MCHADQHWTEALTVVLIGILNAYKEDLQSSATELVYSAPLCVHGDLLVPSASEFEASKFMQQLRRHMYQLRPTPSAHQSSPSTFGHKDLRDSSQSSSIKTLYAVP